MFILPPYMHTQTQSDVRRLIFRLVFSCFFFNGTGSRFSFCFLALFSLSTFVSSVGSTDVTDATGSSLVVWWNRHEMRCSAEPALRSSTGLHAAGDWTLMPPKWWILRHPADEKRQTADANRVASAPANRGNQRTKRYCSFRKWLRPQQNNEGPLLVPTL